MTKKAETSERAVVVTTAHRGVFFGYTKSTDGDVIKLRSGRLCIYWPATNKGFMGLAAMGPLDGARVGPPADIEIRNITAVLEVAPGAVDLWERQPWK
jgi:hypothetical protein